MKRKLVMLKIVLLVGLGASLPASAVVVFQPSSNLQNIRLEGTAEAVGTISLVAIADGSIGAGSLVDFNFKTKLITTGTVTCSAAACVAPTNFTVAAFGNVLRVTFVTTVAFTAGDALNITGARINANAFGVGTITVNLAATVPAGAPGIPFIGATSLPVADVQRRATTVDVDPAGLILAATQPFLVTVTENFNQALTSATDEAGFGPVELPAETVHTVVR